MPDQPNPPPLPAFAAKAKDLDALRAAVIDAASVGAGLWFSYLFVLLYLLIATGGITHRDLLLENPIKLPFLSVELPLIGFFVLGPLLFLIVHAYVLLHFVLLADKVGVFHAELAAQVGDEDLRTRLRRQLPSNIFVQFLAGPHEVRTGFMGMLLRLIAQISLVIAPLAVLVFILFQFLPYHHEAIAWWQRIAVVIDLALLWTLWPAIARGETCSIAWRDFRRVPVALSAVASAGMLLLVFTVATFPGEWLDKNPVSVRFIPHDPLGEGTSRVSLHDFLLAGNVNLIARKPNSLWSNRLVLPEFDASALPRGLSLRGRRLEGAVLVEAKLRGADFTATNLEGAALDGADLREARFECASPRARSLATKEGSERVCARLDKATLSNTLLQGAVLDRAQLREAFLQRARLQGASLDSADLQGADLQDAQLQGANLADAELRGARLQRAGLQGASLTTAQLQGALLDSANLQGASLVNARLDGASLTDTMLHGANLMDASFRGAFMNGVYVWRSSPPTSARIVAPETRPKYGCPDRDGRIAICDWTAKSFNDLKELIAKEVPAGEMRENALRNIAVLDPGRPAPEEKDMAKAWADAARARFDAAAYERDLREVGCSEDGAPFVISSISENLQERFESGSPRLAALAALFLDEAQCPGARGLSEEDKDTLRGLRDGASTKPAGTGAPAPKR
jgi:uncharacterized protein YjbI with pentapeptide repeats